MRIIDAPLGITPDEYFTGKVNLAKILEAAQGDPLGLFRVTFEARARTDWHSHNGVQVLYVVSGECRLQKQGEPVQSADAGTVVVIEAGENHWHGAGPGGEMTHLAIGMFEVTDWNEPVTAEEYDGVV